MPIKITKPTDEVKIENLKVLIYAPPGSGKTSLAFTAETPLLLDFDNGSYRAANRQDVVQVTEWNDVVSISQADLAPYKTVVIDTAGRMLDVMALHLRSDKANCKRDGELSLQGFGKLKSLFDSFISKLIAMKKDIVLIAHEKNVRVSDEINLMKPHIQGSSYDIVVRAMDLIGYLSILKGKRTLDFNQTEATVGKNSASLPNIEVPPMGDVSFDTCLADLLNRSKQFINTQGKKQKDFYELRKKVLACATPLDFDNMLTEIQSIKDENLKKMVKQLLLEQTTSQGVIYDQTAKRFISKPITTEKQ